MIAKVLIIGLGNIGLLYDFNKKNMQLTHSTAFYNNKSFKLIGGVDKSKYKINLFKKKFNIEGFTEIGHALKKLTPDIIVISTETDKHLKIINKIFSYKNNCKMIICEKPCGKSLTEIKKIDKVSKKNECKILVNYMRISSQYALYLKKFSNSNKEHFRGVSYYTKGILNDASHYINLFQFIFGKVIKIKNDIYKSQNSKINNFTLFFKNGEIKFICLNNLSYNNNKFEIYFQKNMIYYNSDQNILKIFNIINNKIYGNKVISEKSKKTFNLGLKDIQSDVVKQILKMKKNENYHLIEIKEAIKTMEIINKLK